MYQYIEHFLSNNLQAEVAELQSSTDIMSTLVDGIEPTVDPDLYCHMAIMF